MDNTVPREPHDHLDARDHLDGTGRGDHERWLGRRAGRQHRRAGMDREAQRRSGVPRGRRRICVRRFDGRNLRRVDESTGATRWTFAAGSTISRAATFIGEWVVFGTAGSTDYWLVAKTGDVRWNLPEMGPVAGVAGADGFSVTTDTNGYIRGAKAPTDDWQAWQASQGSDLAAAPAVVNGEVFVAGMNDTINVYTVPGTPAY